MIPIKFLRENTDAIRADLEKRNASEKLVWVDEILKWDEEWRKAKHAADQLKAERNRLSLKINELKKSGQDPSSILLQVRTIPHSIAELDAKAADLTKKMHHHQMRLPNLLHESVPVGKDDSENTVIREYGTKPSFGFTPKSHTALLEDLNLADLSRAAKITGSRFYFLLGDLARLEIALQKYGVDFLASRGYTLVQPPFMMNRAAYEGVVDLGDFEDVMYKVDGEDLYLIATSEHPLTARFKDETLMAAELPIKNAGISTNFRRETGTHGKEEKGIWRVHQFNKIEQIIICKPDQSWPLHEELIGNAIAFFESLGIAFRQTSICTGDIGTVAAKKYDLDAWIPSVGQYKEIASCSNCTFYQAARLNLRYEAGDGSQYVHTLNSTLVATSRALVAIMEQNQQADGNIRIPKVLVSYMNGQTMIKK